MFTFLADVGRQVGVWVTTYCISKLFAEIFKQKPEEPTTVVIPQEKCSPNTTELDRDTMQQELREKARRALGLDDARYNIAFSGEGKVGKFSMINVLLGLKDKDPKAARVGITETTHSARRYDFNESVSLWDLPGAGTV